ncbi:hypothetical protein V8G54_027420 [Vigna mungo]|uniref:Uncharacterized protein n=1 Tax=Vigna mungo TaxID=3915 RepID=A0AAQ3RRD2_VIGMU
MLKLGQPHTPDHDSLINFHQVMFDFLSQSKVPKWTFYSSFKMLVQRSEGSLERPLRPQTFIHIIICIEIGIPFFKLIILFVYFIVHFNSTKRIPMLLFCAIMKCIASRILARKDKPSIIKA